MAAQKADDQCRLWREQLAAGETVESEAGTIVSADDGLLGWKETGDSDLLAYLPEPFRRDVVLYTHRQNKHARGHRLTEHLKTVFWWPKMQETVSVILKDCHFCLLSRAREAMKHNQYTSMRVTAS